jgi:suppressor for copper-sensitivity B
VLNSKEFKSSMKLNKITLMKGDWTKPNDEINKFLQKANRYGIPFNALYNSNFSNGLVYSEILSLKEIRESLLKLHISNAR